MQLADKVIIITGAGQGIGVTYGHGLSERGAKVVLADINFAGVQKVAAEVEAKGGQALAVKADVTSPEDVDRMVKETVTRFGRIDALINNAALSSDLPRKRFWEFEPAEFKRVLEVNLAGAWLCSRAVFPYMKQQGGGKIVNVSSGTFWEGKAGLAHYVSSKGGIIGLTRVMAREAGEYNINVNVVAPGLTVHDEILKTLPWAGERGFENRCLQRVERPQDLVGVVAFLCSSDSAFITGQAIVVDGGVALH